MERKLEELSDIELKSLAYDTLVQLQLHQQNMQTINVELGRRAQAANPIRPALPPNTMRPDGVTPEA